MFAYTTPFVRVLAGPDGSYFVRSFVRSLVNLLIEQVVLR